MSVVLPLNPSPQPSGAPSAGPPWRGSADVETSSDAYADRFAGEVGAWFLEVQAATALELLAPWPGARVLDVGGGHGQLAPPLLNHGYDVTVAGSAEACRGRLDRLLGPSCPFVPCDLLDLPFPDRSFDVVACFRLLAHEEAWPRLLASLCRVADRAVIADFSDLRSFNALYRPLFPWKRRIEGDTRAFRRFRPGEVASELARHGFGRPLERRQFFWPMVAHRGLRHAGISRAAERLGSGLGLTRRFGSPVVLRAERLDEAPGGGSAIR